MAVDGTVKQVGVGWYSLLPYHREINLIELVWSEIKSRVAVNSTQFSAAFMDSLIRDTNSRPAGRHVQHTEQQIGRRNDAPLTARRRFLRLKFHC